MCDWEKYEYSENPVPTAVAPQKVVKLPKIAEIRQPGKANKTVQSGNMTLKYDENGYVREIYENGKLKFNIRNVETELWDMEKGTITKTGEWIRYYWYYEYNADGKKTGEYHVDEEGKAGGFKRYEYNEEGQKSRVIDYHPNGRVGVYWELEYNDEGKRIANPQCDPETGRKVTSGRALFDFD